MAKERLLLFADPPITSPPLWCFEGVVATLCDEVSKMAPVELFVLLLLAATRRRARAIARLMALHCAEATSEAEETQTAGEAEEAEVDVLVSLCCL